MLRILLIILRELFSLSNAFWSLHVRTCVVCQYMQRLVDNGDFCHQRLMTDTVKVSKGWSDVTRARGLRILVGVFPPIMWQCDTPPYILQWTKWAFSRPFTHMHYERVFLPFLCVYVWYTKGMSERASECVQGSFSFSKKVWIGSKEGDFVRERVMHMARKNAQWWCGFRGNLKEAWRSPLCLMKEMNFL